MRTGSVAGIPETLSVEEIIRSVPMTLSIASDGASYYLTAPANSIRGGKVTVERQMLDHTGNTDPRQIWLAGKGMAKHEIMLISESTNELLCAPENDSPVTLAAHTETPESGCHWNPAPSRNGILFQLVRDEKMYLSAGEKNSPVEAGDTVCDRHPTGTPNELWYAYPPVKKFLSDNGTY